MLKAYHKKPVISMKIEREQDSIIVDRTFRYWGILSAGYRELPIWSTMQLWKAFSLSRLHCAGRYSWPQKSPAVVWKIYAWRSIQLFYCAL